MQKGVGTIKIADGEDLRSAIALEANYSHDCRQCRTIGRVVGVRLEGGTRLPEAKIMRPRISRLCELASSASKPIIPLNQDFCGSESRGDNCGRVIKRVIEYVAAAGAAA